MLHKWKHISDSSFEECSSERTFSSDKIHVLWIAVEENWDAKRSLELWVEDSAWGGHRQKLEGPEWGGRHWGRGVRMRGPGIRVCVGLAPSLLSFQSIFIILYLVHFHQFWSLFAAVSGTIKGSISKGLKSILEIFFVSYWWNYWFFTHKFMTHDAMQWEMLGSNKTFQVRGLNFMNYG